MANYTATQLLSARFRFDKQFERPEMRPKPNPVMMSLLKNSEVLVPELDSIKNSDQRTKATHILNRASTSSGTARTHSHTGSVGDSTLANMTWVTRTRYFKMSVKMGDRNEETWQQMFANRVLSSIMDLHTDIETYMVAWLNTNRSQVVKSLTPKNVSWDASNYLAKVTNANKNFFAQYGKSFMRQQWYDWELDAIADPLIYAMIQQQYAQGPANDTNLGFQFAGIEFLESIDDLTNPTGVQGSAYLIPKGTVGIVPWIPSANRNNVKEGIYEYSSIPDPLGTGLTFAVHRYTAGADNSSTFGETQDVNQFYEVSIDFSAVKGMISTSNETPIFKIGLQT